MIFDFDGLILDTETPVFQSWLELFQEHGCQLTVADWADDIGRADTSFDFLDHLEQQLGRRVDRETLSGPRRAREAQLIDQQPLRPGVREYLERAHQLGLMLGIASSSSCQWVTSHLSRLGLLQYFDCLRGADDVQVTKPAPDLYLAVLEGLGLQASEAIALEDSPHGITAAKRAGLCCVVIPNQLTCQLPVDHADLRLDSLADLDLDGLLAYFSAQRYSCANGDES